MTTKSNGQVYIVNGPLDNEMGITKTTKHNGVKALLT